MVVLVPHITGADIHPDYTLVPFMVVLLPHIIGAYIYPDYTQNYSKGAGGTYLPYFLVHSE